MTKKSHLLKISIKDKLLRPFRHFRTWVLRILRSGKNPIFFKDILIGKFSGNILESISKYYPPDAAAIIEAATPAIASWKVYERITWAGARGFRYFVSPGTSIKVLEVVSSIYPEKHRMKGYPGMFDGSEDDLPGFCLDVDYDDENNEIVINNEYFVIWLPAKVQLNVSNN